MTTIKNVLFADDTTILGEHQHIEEAKSTTKKVMSFFEEQTNETKEVNLVIGEAEAANTRFLGTWLGEKEDTNIRIQRGMGAWSKVKKRLKHSRLSKRTQARVVEAVVESTMMFNCSTRTWNASEINRMQKKADQCYRYIWSSKTKPPLMEMEEKHMNRWNVRKELRVRSIRNKIEKRSLERLGHVLRMPEESRTKQVTFGWLSKLECTDKERKKFRCTPRYWIKLAREAGWDPLEINDFAQDRERWRGLIRERSRHIELWESSQENGWTGDSVTRTEQGHLDSTAKIECAQCGKQCVSRAGLAIHMKRMHSQARTDHTCTKCNRTFSQKANLKNHEKKCQGKTSPTKHVRTLKECPSCKVPQDATNLRRHLRSCGQQMGTPSG